MSIPSISPVIGRIQSIESRFSVPSDSRVSVSFGSTSPDDFAAALSAAFADSSATLMAASGAATAPSSTTVAPGPSTSLTLGGSGRYATPLSDATGAMAAPAASGASAAGGPSPFEALFQEAGARHGVPGELLSAVGWVESRYQTDAISSAGAIGLMQIMPFVADELGVDPRDPVQAIDGAARLLRSHHDRFGSWDLALAAYNAGAGAVKRAGNTIPSPGVAEYVRRVNERMAQS